MVDKAGAGTYHAGFACFVGRPNAGKSTLTNAIIGQKIAITSTRPQTTRHVIRGVLHRSDAQLVLVDTPGLHRPRTLLGERLNDLVREVWSEVDVIGLCLPANWPATCPTWRRSPTSPTLCRSVQSPGSSSMSWSTCSAATSPSRPSCTR